MKPRKTARCLACSKELKSGSADAHLKTCIARTPEEPGSPSMLLMRAAAGYGRTKNVYLLYALLPENATLKTLDHLLRERWMECCGHLSAFHIKQAAHGPYKYRELAFHLPATAIPKGEEARYEYDMGDTTAAAVSISRAPASAAAWLTAHGLKPGAPVMINLLPETCDRCGAEGNYINNETGTVTCEACLPAKRGAFRGLENSPRDGVFCYNPATFEDQDGPDPDEDEPPPAEPHPAQGRLAFAAAG